MQETAGCDYFRTPVICAGIKISGIGIIVRWHGNDDAFRIGIGKFLIQCGGEVQVLGCQIFRNSLSKMGDLPLLMRSTFAAVVLMAWTSLSWAKRVAMDKPTYPIPATVIFILYKCSSLLIK